MAIALAFCGNGPAMRLLIDGYNLLHASDRFGVGELAGTLQGARESLLDWLAQHLTEKERRTTVIVFDARDAPPGLPDRVEFQAIRIRFARGYEDADALLEEIIEKAKGTKQLVVVSADHRVQRAARSRGAKPIDSQDWIREVGNRVHEASEPSVQRYSVGSAKEWLEAFSDPELLEQIEREAQAAPPPRRRVPLDPTPPDSLPADSSVDTPGAAPAESLPRARRKHRHTEFPPADSKADFGAGLLDPFPPGYAADLAQEAERLLRPRKPHDPNEST
ncbi:NYN domain-containing protein [Botrimarina hoheduenensis]|uniref:YacP-like NYN domain protein n=1 Tax=Botrimarina hoheduenensis TaxID=2528000 RepID=A0A5C5WBG0_9BACT|nr:NYN domain-containing protein [Botrimarina hoheduenensis]TWT48256.1 YacP-like NYN domain protein [Botrimarina hoheduenensis]